MFNLMSLFSGCGGIDLGFRGDFAYLGTHFAKLPFRTVWANDWDKQAVVVYNSNFGTKYQACDVKTVDFERLPLVSNDIEVLVGGFPCQEFSLSGPRDGLNSDRGRLYTEIRRALDVFKPKIVLAENVPGIEYPPTMLEIITDTLGEGGTPRYVFEVHRVNAADFGIPQVRRRVVLVGTRSDIALPFRPPRPTHRAPLAELDGQEVPRWMRPTIQENVRESKHLPTWLTARDGIDDIWSPSGTDCTSVPDQDKRTRATIAFENRKRRDRQLQAELPSPTIRAQHHGHIEVHYGTQADGSLRRLTIRECARLQGFPDNFEFPTSATQAYVQIGNAMPPVVCTSLGKSHCPLVEIV